jgi:hypothetical protein
MVDAIARSGKEPTGRCIKVRLSWVGVVVDGLRRSFVRLFQRKYSSGSDQSEPLSRTGPWDDYVRILLAESGSRTTERHHQTNRTG